MRKIYKYPVELDRSEVVTHENSLFRHFATQDDQLCVWLEVDPSKPRALRTYVIVGTGYTIPMYAEYRATCFAGPFVWHLYEL